MTKATEEKTRPTIGEELRRLRKERGWTQAELAAKAGISRQALSAIEQGKAKPKAGTIFNLIAALKIPIKDIIDDEGLQSEEFLKVKESLRPLYRTLQVAVPKLVERVRALAEEAARQIKAERIARGWTQERLSKEAGISQDEISRLETMDFRGWSLHKLKILADTLDIDLERIDLERFMARLDKKA